MQKENISTQNSSNPNQSRKKKQKTLTLLHKFISKRKRNSEKKNFDMPQPIKQPDE